MALKKLALWNTAVLDLRLRDVKCVVLQVVVYHAMAYLQFGGTLAKLNNTKRINNRTRMQVGVLMITLAVHKDCHQPQSRT